MKNQTKPGMIAWVSALFATIVAWADAKTDELAAMFGVKGLRKDSRADGSMSDIAIGGILVILSFVIVLAFWPVLTGSINTAVDDPNTSTTAGVVLGLIPLTFAAALLISGIAFLVRGVKSLG